MGITRADRASNLVDIEVWNARKRDAALGREATRDDNSDDDLSEDQQKELEIARWCMQLLRDSERAREPYEAFEDCWDIFNGNVWPSKYPVWKAKITLNKIRAFIWFMQAVMTDQKPRINVEPLSKASTQAAKILGKLVDRDWDENDAQKYIALAVLYGLIFGTGFLKITYNPDAAGGKGKHEWSAPVPYRIWTNKTATCPEDADHIIHIEEQTMSWVARNYPEKYATVRKFKGAHVSSRSEGAGARDPVREGFGDSRLPIENAVRTAINNVMQDLGKPSRNMDDNDTIDVGEFWFHDVETEDYERQKMIDGKPGMKDDIDADGLPVLQISGYAIGMSEIDGQPFSYPKYKIKQVPDMETATRLKYPNGRLVVMCGPVVVRDIPNPFQIDGFPFASWRNQDVGAAWGTGEPLGLKDGNVAINRLISQAYDIIEKTGNPQLKYKKGSGLDVRSLKNKPGSIISLDEIDALQMLETKPIQPAHLELVSVLKGFLGEVAGLQDAVMGAAQASNTAFATVDSLQESGAAPLRARVRGMERMVGRAGKLRVQLIQQFDRADRPIRERINNQAPAPIADEDGEPIAVPMPIDAVQTRFTEYKQADIQGRVEFTIVPDSSMSVSPAGLKNFYLMLYDKHIVDQQAVLDKLKIDDGELILNRMQKAAAAAAQQKAASKAKPGPAPRPGGGSKGTPSPPSQIPSRKQNAGVR